MSLRLPHIAAWPLVVKVPVLVAGLMITVAFTICQIVLWRFVQDQENNVRLLTSAYLDGLSAAILPAITQGDVWEVFDALDHARSRYAGIETRYAIVELPDGRILAASDPLKFPVRAVVPDEVRNRFGPEDGLFVDSGEGRAWLARRLFADRFPVGRLLAEIDIADLLRGRREILLTLVVVNGCLTLAFALGGYFVLKGILQPFGVLARHMEQVREGRVEPIAADRRKRVAREFSQLFDRFNAMAQALNEQQTLQMQLADQEKYVMLGRLASGMAHEVNNPLGGMLNAIDTIQVHGGDPVVLQKSLDFLKRGLAGIRNVARAALVTYKGGPSTDLLTRSDLDDLPFLVQHEIGARRVRLEWQNRIAEPIMIDGAAVRQITLNLLLNACAASPLGGRVAVAVWCSDDALRISVSDEGPGLSEEMAALLYQAASATGRLQETKGLGLWMSGHLIRRLAGHAEVKYPGVGTRVVMTLPVAAKQAGDAA
jgi:two-component system, OmpR family, sensor kinase